MHVMYMYRYAKTLYISSWNFLIVTFSGIYTVRIGLICKSFCLSARRMRQRGKLLCDQEHVARVGYLSQELPERKHVPFS